MLPVSIISVLSLTTFPHTPSWHPHCIPDFEWFHIVDIYRPFSIETLQDTVTFKKISPITLKTDFNINEIERERKKENKIGTYIHKDKIIFTIYVSLRYI